MYLRRKRYGKVAFGGTFDRLHRGHKRLIDVALNVGDRVLIGVAAREMLEEHSKSHEVEGYSERVKALRSYLEERGGVERVDIVSLSDPYEPALTDRSIDVLLVSIETAPRGRDLNRLRMESGLKPLKLMVINMVKAQDGAPISSSRIRRGEIDREGRLLA